MKLLNAIAVTALFAVPATGAVAQERYPSIWTGAYVGAHIGGAWGKWVPPEDDAIKGNGFAGGLYAGGNYQMGQTVAGLEVDHMFGGPSKSKTYDGGLGKLTVDTTGITTLRGRVGILVTPSTLLYGTLGYGWGSLKVKDVYDGDVYKENESTKGFVFGGGIETRMWQNVALRGEILQYQLKARFNDGVDVWTVKSPVTVVRGGISYNF